MPQDVAALAPTSTAATRETEPEVVAGISSADLRPGQKLAIRIAGAERGYADILASFAAGLAVGYGATRWLRTRE